ncbi:hypothetical protein A2609_00350 [Candidatus Kaiserbacteria bacterium RIFOXYD1_FULL_47_14]|uniref:Uncharacterized protein n=1 Tax=Candidatus Kaiserbacteria bacterium RIFOXYD1_FULL_47_14 TaxID=1798533 RepID=A0A1F6G600_9BACT|nr:MAG: hypothetical protein A2609_00350 [Candidatus Kaiserbacteria bacterium RIFOXYD1_FULL_47_14]
MWAGLTCPNKKAKNLVQCGYMLRSIRIEIQAGFTGINDIKQHKVLEAKRVFRDNGTRTLAIYFDLCNWQVAFIKLNEIEDDDMNWITRTNLDDGLVWNIDQNFFFWNLTQSSLKFKQLKSIVF